MKREVDIVVVGGGPSGIGAAIRLRQAGLLDFVLLEKKSELGGTWRDNTYPGCACDVPSALYSFSFAPNPEWTRAFAGQGEIRRYLLDVAERYGVLEHVQYGTEVLTAKWDEASHRWEIETTQGHYSARFIIGAAGPWHEPNIPKLPGLDAFVAQGGVAFHSSRWDHSYALTGKRVAVIGTGASAVQFVPHIQPLAAKLHLFQRTAHWVLPKPDHYVPRAERWVMRTFPSAQRALRAAEYGGLEVFGLGFRHPRILEVVQRLGERHLRRTIQDPDLRRRLTPSYTLGCKRLLMSNSYYPALANPNVEVHATAVTAIDGRRIVGADGTGEDVDAIIFGTGFHILDMPIASRVFDGRGRSMAERFQGSPRAYYGTTVNGFPNFFMLLGPNLGTGHSSAFTILEAQLEYVIDGLRKIRTAGATRVEVRSDVQDAYNAEVEAVLPRTVYNAGGCASYYLDANGRNSFAWPWSTPALVQRLGTFDLAAYDADVETPVARAPKKNLRRAPTAMDLRDAVVLVTGGGRGIGRATAEAFARAGARVLIGDRDEDSARQAAEAIDRAHVSAVRVDVTDRASFRAFVDQALKRWGRIDVLVNNAGIMPVGAFIDEAEARDRLTMDVNVWGLVHGMRCVLGGPLGMLARGEGHIVNVTSMAGKIPVPGLSVYNASKFAAVGLSAAVRQELAGTGVTLTTILPAAVRTGLSSGVPLGRGLPTVEPEVVARAIVESCRTRPAEITVPSFLRAWDLVDAVVPDRVISFVRSLVDDRRALTSIDPAARRDYEERIEAQTAHGSTKSLGATGLHVASRH